MLCVSHKKEIKRSGELVSIKQLDLLSALVKSSGRNQNDQERERGLQGSSFWKSLRLTLLVCMCGFIQVYRHFHTCVFHPGMKNSLECFSVQRCSPELHFFLSPVQKLEPDFQTICLAVSWSQ